MLPCKFHPKALVFIYIILIEYYYSFFFLLFYFIIYYISMTIRIKNKIIYILYLYLSFALLFSGLIKRGI